MKNLLIILFSFVAFPAFCQVEAGCIEINFETLPTVTPQDGLTISDQFTEIFGLTFSLQGGGSPVLGRVGSPATAFGSSWGDDTAVPGADIGQFFLTDDGFLSGLQAIPVILDFEVPIDSFAGCILDMDFDEFFIITALDDSDNIVLADTIRAGDPGTGDGELTCWGFNLEGCEGSVYRIVYEGFRASDGAFGLGLDNFSFCYSGLQIGVEAQDADCNQLGQITVFNTHVEEYEYSYDNINFSSNGTFTDLDAGTHTIYVRDSDGCIAPVELELFSPAPYVSDVSVIPTSCGEDNGIIQIQVSEQNGIQYSLDGVNFQESNLFENLPPDEYIITIVDADNCVDFDEAVIFPSEGPEISGTVDIDDTCETGIGSILVEATGGDGTLLYSIDNINFQESPIFQNLSAGEYDIIVVDESECPAFEQVTLATTAAVIWDDVDFNNAVCDEDNGFINVQASGGEGTLMYSIDGTTFQEQGLFENLPAGTYDVLITDSNNCTAGQVVEIDSPPQSLINDIDVTNTTCDEINGSLSVNVSPAAGVEYSLNGGPYQSNNTFSNLEPGTYTISILDENDCPDNMEETILPSAAPQIDNTTTVIDSCQSSAGEITILARSQNGGLEFSIDGINYYESNNFTNLSEGNYTAYVQDDAGCTAESLVSISGSPSIGIGIVDITSPSCFDDDGIITLNPFGGTGEIMFAINGGIIQSENNFENLHSGEYEVSFIDELGCETSQVVTIPIPLCPIYIPNVISANSDNQDEVFQIFTNNRYEVGILDYRIYDRWGELVYTAENFSIHTSDKIWWDGNFNDGPAEQDVYTYMIEVLHPNGYQEVFAGDVTLLR